MKNTFSEGGRVLPQFRVAAARLARQHGAAFSSLGLSLLVLESHLRLFTEVASPPRRLTALRRLQKAKACVPASFY